MITMIQNMEKIIFNVIRMRNPTALKITPTNLNMRNTPPIIKSRNIAPRKLNIVLTSFFLKKKQSQLKSRKLQFKKFITV